MATITTGLGDAVVDWRERIKVLHIEPSTRCTLACIHCPRTIHSELVGIDDIDIDMIVRQCEGVEELSMCGDHGDPIYHPRFHELLESVRAAYPDIRFWINTNGAFRSREWWARLAGILDGRDVVVFSIDGLPNNNHIYRVNSKWEGIEQGVEALRSGNPKLWMIWKWILFNYNENDVMAGMRLAKRMGFNQFKVIGSSRERLPDPVLATKTVRDVRRELIASGLSTLQAR